MKENIEIPNPLDQNEPQKINRKERRKQMRFYLTEFKKHIDNKPEVNLSLEGEDAQNQVFKMQAWATRYGSFLRKLDSLGYDFKKDSEGLHKRNVEQGRVAEQRVRETGSVEIDDMQVMRDPRSGDNEVSEE